MAAPNDVRTSLERKRAALRREVSTWEPTWKGLARCLAPYLGYFEGDLPNEGNRRDDDIIDGTALRAINVFTSGLQSGLTSPARPWFRLTTTDPELGKSKRVRSWLDDVQRIMMEIFSESNFYDELLRVYAELAVFGTGAMLISEDYETVIRCRAYTAGEYCLGLNAERRVDTFYMLARLTPRQMVGRFGIDMVSDAVRDAYENGHADDTYREVHFLSSRTTERYHSSHRTSVPEGDPLGVLRRWIGCRRWPVTTSSLYRRHDGTPRAVTCTDEVQGGTRWVTSRCFRRCRRIS